jgi:hypothetical protein
MFKYNVTEERLDVNSPEYRLMKKIHKMNTAPTITPEFLQDENEDFQERRIVGGKDGKEEVVIVSWNPIIEIKRCRRAGDLMLNLDLKTSLDFTSAVVAAMYPDVVTRYLFSAENRHVMEKAFQLYNKYMSQFNNKKWDYLWFEWFWIVRYSQAQAPKKAVRMLQALDGKKRKISLKQIKNKTKEVLHFLTEFFYYIRLLITSINEIKILHSLIINRALIIHQYSIFYYGRILSLSADNILGSSSTDFNFLPLMYSSS